VSEPALGNLISRAEMARRLGVTRGAVTRQCDPGGPLAAACNGKWVDVSHPAAQRQLAKSAAARGMPLAEVEAPEAPEAPEPEAPPDAEPIDVEALRSVSASGSASDLLGPELAELATGGKVEPALLPGLLRCRKLYAEARHKEILQARVEGKVIARTTVINAFGHVDVAFRLLLTDAPRAIAMRLGAANMPAAAAMIRDVMEQQLEACRSHIAASIEADDPLAPLMEAAE
jgi:hypothetical protein